MKTTLSLLLGLSLLISTTNLFAQDDTKLRNDPTYSTQNYKHANKAATARRWETNRGVTVQAPAPANNQVANYKNPVPNQTPVGSVTAAHTVNERVANRNYKQQQPRLNDEQTGEMARKKNNRDKSGKDGSAVGEE